MHMMKWQPLSQAATSLKPQEKKACRPSVLLRDGGIEIGRIIASEKAFRALMLVVSNRPPHIFGLGGRRRRLAPRISVRLRLHLEKGAASSSSRASTAL